MTSQQLSIEERLNLLRVRYEESGMPKCWIPTHRTLDCERGSPLLWNKLHEDGRSEISPMAMRLAASGPALVELLLSLVEETGRFSAYELEAIYARLAYLVPQAGVQWKNRSGA